MTHSAAPDLCLEYNGGCHQNAACNQTGLLVNCTCHSGYQGDGYSCEPINRWAWFIISSQFTVLCEFQPLSPVFHKKRRYVFIYILFMICVYVDEAAERVTSAGFSVQVC